MVKIRTYKIVCPSCQGVPGIICPACGSTGVQTITEVETVSKPLVPRSKHREEVQNPFVPRPIIQEEHELTDLEKILKRMKREKERRDHDMDKGIWERRFKHGEWIPKAKWTNCAENGIYSANYQVAF